MARDPRVFLLGEDVTTGGYFNVSAGLVEEFGPGRVIDTPISEYAIVGAAVGAAMTGMRPVAEILFSDSLTCCMDPIINQAAKLRYMSGGQYQLPLVVRTPGGAGLGMAAQHSQSWEALLTGTPGLLIVAPGTPADAKGLLKAAPARVAAMDVPIPYNRALENAAVPDLNELRWQWKDSWTEDQGNLPWKYRRGPRDCEVLVNELSGACAPVLQSTHRKQ